MPIPEPTPTPTPTPTSTSTRRETGATRGIWVAPISNSGVVGTKMWLNNAYNVSRSVSSNEIDTTAFGDYPWGTAEPGMLSLSIDLSMRVQQGAADVAFMEDHALNRKPFRIGLVRNRALGAQPGGGQEFSVVATKADESGDVSSAQDLSYTLVRSAAGPAPVLIGGGPPTPMPTPTS